MTPTDDPTFARARREVQRVRVRARRDWFACEEDIDDNEDGQWRYEDGLDHDALKLMEG